MSLALSFLTRGLSNLNFSLLLFPSSKFHLAEGRENRWVSD